MYKFKSDCERDAAPTIAKLGGYPTESFTPLLTKVYEDAANAVLHGKPDFCVERGGGFHFIEMKDSILNDHYTEASSTEGLRKAYAEVFGRGGDHLSQSDLCTALYRKGFRGKQLEREHSWHNSLWKVAALQAQHGYQRYLVVFARNPTGRDAARYCAAGLVFCTLKTLPEMLERIELLRHGIAVPFHHSGKNYSFTVTAEMSSRKLAAADVQMIDRGRFLASVAADKAAVTAQRIQDDLDWEAGLRPF